MHTNKKGRPPAAHKITLRTPDYKKIAFKINALFNLLALYDMAMFAVLAVVLWGALR